MNKLCATTLTVVTALAAPAFAADRDTSNYAETTMESPMNVALPGASGAQHRHFKDTVHKPVSSAMIEELRQMAIAAGQTSSSKGSAEKANKLSGRDKATIDRSREAFDARVRQRSGE